MNSWWCEDEWRDIEVENMTDSDCFGRHAVVRARYALLRQFLRDINELSSLEPLQNLDQSDSEIVRYLHLLGSESKVTVTLEQGEVIFNAKWVLCSKLGRSTSNQVELAETVLARLLVEVLVSRKIMQKPVAADSKCLNSIPRVWWCEDDWMKVENITDSDCSGKHAVFYAKNALYRQFEKDIKALNALEPLQNLVELGDNEVIDCLHLLGCESVNCKITLQHEDDTFCAEWYLPTNSVVKSSSFVSNSCAFCGAVLAETVLGRILVEVLVAKRLLHKQNTVRSSEEPLCLTSNASVSPTTHQLPDSPCSAITLLNEDTGETSTSSQPASNRVHEDFLSSLQFEAEEKVRIHDSLEAREPMEQEPVELEPMEQEPVELEPMEQEPVEQEQVEQKQMDTAAPETPVDYPLNPLLHTPKPRTFLLPNRRQMMAISLEGPGKKIEEKEKVLRTLASEESISKLGRLTGLRCNRDPNWSLNVLKCALKCKQLHRVEVMWPRRDHWYLIQNLLFLRKLEIYADDELYANPPTVKLPKSHALRIEIIQAEGLHPTTLGSLMRAFKSLVRLEVLVDLPGDCSLPKDKPIGPKDGGRPLSDGELRKLLERAPGASASSQSQEMTSTKLVRLALRKPRNVLLPLALPVSMFPKDWRRTGSGRSGLLRRAGRARRETLFSFSEYAVPVEEDCRRYPNLQGLVLNRPVDSKARTKHDSKACIHQLQALRRKWPSMVITCQRDCDKKTQTQRGSSAPRNLANSEAKDRKDFYYKSIRNSKNKK